jgi:hypothetical protein
VSAHPSPEALLQDAELRLDSFGSDHGVLFVEGSDDKRFIYSRARNRQQIVVANGRGRLLTTYALARTRGIEGLVFLIDCDYEVARGNISPAEDLIISQHADIESDLFDLSGFERIALQFVPRTLNNDEELERVINHLMQRAVVFADALGKIRRVAIDLACKVDTKTVRHNRYRQGSGAQIDVPRLVRTLVQNSPDCTISVQEFQSRVDAIPSHYDNCNGHDLAAAVNHILREDFGVRDQTPDSIETTLRMSTPDAEFEKLKVTEYLRRWESRTSRRVLVS